MFNGHPTFGRGGRAQAISNDRQLEQGTEYAAALVLTQANLPVYSAEDK